MRRAITLALCALGAACGSTEVRSVDLSAAGDGVGWVLIAANDGRWSVASGPFGLEDGRLEFGARPQLSLEDGEQPLVLVVPDASLVDAMPGFDPAWKAEVGLLLDRDLPLELLPDGRLSAGTPLPDDARLWVGGADPVAEDDPRLLDARSQISLRIPFDPEHCRPQTELTMQPWGGVEKPLAGLRGLGFGDHLRNVAIVDADHIIAQNPEALFALTRGQSLGPADAMGPPYRVLSIETLRGRPTPGRLDQVAVDPRPGPTRKVLATARFDGPPEVGVLFSAVHTPDGLVDIRTATVVDHMLRAVAFAANGDWVASGDRGLVLFGDADSERVRRGPRAGDGEFDDTTRSAVATGDPTRPWIVSGRSQLHVFSTERQTWDTSKLGDILQDNIHLYGLAATYTQGSLHAWAGGSSGRIFLYERDGMWPQASLDMPPRFGGCTQDVGAARPVYRIDVDDMSIADDHLYIVADDCNVVLQVRLTDQCTSMLSFGGQPVGASDDVAEGVDTKDGMLVVVADEGRVWEASTRR